MAKPIKNRTVSGSACLNYANNDIGLIITNPVGRDDYRIGLDFLPNFEGCGELAGLVVDPSTDSGRIRYMRTFDFFKFSHNNRVVGLILDENDDGSYKIALLGSDTIQWGVASDNVEGTMLITRFYTSFFPPREVSQDVYVYDFPAIMTYGVGSDPSIAYGSVEVNPYSGNEYSGVVPFDDTFNYKLKFSKPNSYYFTPNVFARTGKYRGQKYNNSGGNNHVIELSNNKNNTMVVGCPVSEMIDNIQYNEYCYMYDTYNSIFDAWEGDLYTLLSNIYTTVSISSHNKPSVIITEGNRANLFTRADPSANPKLAGYEGKTHAYSFTPYNLILTRNESQALAYLNNGTLPSDAFLYPLDWQNLPRTDGTPSTQDEDPSVTPPSGEDGDSGIDGTPTRDADPQITSNMLTNNNLYWLQAGQLESFITWFWQNAGEIIELDDLWDRIKGLYNDLASAIINIRYFPVDPYYIGGVSDTTNIVLSSIEMPITGIKKLNKTKLRKRTLGEISIPNKYNAFTDYSPYTSLMLYLPFHGWIDLDIDIFTGNKLQVRCIYDHISGTIQYGVYVISKGKEFLLNTVIAKMAVDIPITLQSKNDRDSAIFNNVTNAFGNLLGAGASAVSGNPIGLVMSTAGVASSGTQSAPLKVNGTVGETGAFFMPNKCAVYIKRPSYNRPKNYGARVGYPSNQGGKLSEFTGYTTVYNPQITFSGNTNADNVTIKPLQSEIDEIYTALEKGVIL